MLWKKRKTQQLNYFVSIGAGLNQIPLIIEAKKQGFNVIGVDNNVSAPGFMHCDLKIQESIDNKESIYKMLLELLVDGDIRGILTKSYGTAIITTSYLAERFKVPYLPHSMSGCFINKKKMKSIFMDHDILTPYLLPVRAKAKIPRIPSSAFPVIIKPNIGHAKFNVILAHDVMEVQRYFEGTARPEESILEKYIAGDECIAIGIIHEGTFHLAELTDKTTLFPPYFIDTVHTSPSRHLNKADRIERIGQSVANAFGILTAPLVMEFVIDSAGEPYLIEAVPEFGGEFLSDVLIPAASNYQVIREVIRSMTGQGFTPPPVSRKNRKAVAVRYLTGSGGTLASCNPEGPNKVKGTVFSRIFKEIGSPIIEPVTNHDRIGVVVVQAETVDQALALSQEAADNFHIRIK